MFGEIFTEDALQKLFPPERADEFFEALFGDANEGSYDIRLAYCGGDSKQLDFELQLHERPGCCLACNLTYGLPQVFSRHPVINAKGLVAGIDALLGDKGSCGDWQLRSTVEKSRGLHAIPLTIKLS